MNHEQRFLISRQLSCRASMGLHTRDDVHGRDQGDAIRKPHSFISSRLSSTTVRDFGSGEITDPKDQHSDILHLTGNVQNFIPSNISDSTGTSLRPIEANSGINKGYACQAMVYDDQTNGLPFLPYSVYVSSLA